MTSDEVIKALQAEKARADAEREARAASEEQARLRDVERQAQFKQLRAASQVEIDKYTPYLDSVHVQEGGPSFQYPSNSSHWYKPLVSLWCCKHGGGSQNDRVVTLAYLNGIGQVWILAAVSRNPNSNRDKRNIDVSDYKRIGTALPPDATQEQLAEAFAQGIKSLDVFASPVRTNVIGR
jgi:hypothetical protein